MRKRRLPQRGHNSYNWHVHHSSLSQSWWPTLWELAGYSHNHHQVYVFLCNIHGTRHRWGTESHGPRKSDFGNRSQCLCGSSHQTRATRNCAHFPDQPEVSGQPASGRVRQLLCFTTVTTSKPCPGFGPGAHEPVSGHWVPAAPAQHRIQGS